jgi:hypothetical protein
MRWKRVVIGAVLGGLLGFGGQLSADFFGREFIDRGNGQGLQSLWSFVKSGGFDRQRSYWAACGDRRQQLWVQSVLLVWLLERGDRACQAAVIVAFLGASVALTLNQEGKNSAVRSSSKQTNSLATPVGEPKDNASEQEPVEKPAQIEIAAQATVLKTAPKKEHIEA